MYFCCSQNVKFEAQDDSRDDHFTTRNEVCLIMLFYLLNGLTYALPRQEGKLGSWG